MDTTTQNIIYDLIEHGKAEIQSTIYYVDTEKTKNQLDVLYRVETKIALVTYKLDVPLVSSGIHSSNPKLRINYVENATRLDNPYLCYQYEDQRLFIFVGGGVYGNIGVVQLEKSACRIYQEFATLEALPHLAVTGYLLMFTNIKPKKI